MFSSIQQIKVAYSENYYSALNRMVISRPNEMWIHFKCILWKGHQTEKNHMLYDFIYYILQKETTVRVPNNVWLYSIRSKVETNV